MRAAVARACTALEVFSSGEDLDRDLGPGGDEVLVSVRGAAARIWFYWFNSLRESLVHEVVLP